MLPKSLLLASNVNLTEIGRKYEFTPRSIHNTIVYAISLLCYNNTKSTTTATTTTGGSASTSLDSSKEVMLSQNNLLIACEREVLKLKGSDVNYSSDVIAKMFM
jgi:hypothetical protein